MSWKQFGYFSLVVELIALVAVMAFVFAAVGKKELDDYFRKRPLKKGCR